MPVTKKKGAIFAIYADTPPRPETSARAASPTRKSGPSATATASSKPERERAERRVLAPKEARTALAPKATDANRKLGSASMSGAKGKDTLKDTLKPKPTSASKPHAAISQMSHASVSKPSATSTQPSKPRRTLGSSSSSSATRPRSAFTIYVDPPSSSSAAKEKEKDKRPRSPGDKENLGRDSPAARTRSKTTTTKKKLPQSVRPDGPLADVSEAYGASGLEPAGFRDPFLSAPPTPSDLAEPQTP